MSDRKQHEMSRRQQRRIKRWERSLTIVFVQREQQEVLAPAWVREAVR